MSCVSEPHRRNSGRGLEILAVTTETPTDRPKIERYIEEHRLPFPVYADGLNRRYDVRALPTTIVIDRAGRACYYAADFGSAIRAINIVIDELLK